MTLDSEDNPVQPVKAALFEATQWSLVLRAREKSESAIGALCFGYRQPLIVWLRLRGHSPEDAEDLVQGFFAVLLNRDFLAKVSPDKGTFRSFLLKCLKRYVSDERGKLLARKRGGGASVASLDEVNESGQVVHDPASSEASPDREFDRAFARAVLSNAFKRLEEEAARQRHAALCSLLLPVMYAEESALSYKEVAGKLDMTEASVKTAAHRLRKRLRALIEEEVRQTVANERDWRDEVRYMMRLFEPSSQGLK